MSPTELAKIKEATAIINLSALASNFEVLKNLSPERPLLCMVKANAYGHGMKIVSEFLQSNFVGEKFGLGVSRLSEAQFLRQHGFQGQIVVMSYLPDENDLTLFNELNLTPVLSCDDHIISLIRSVEKYGLPYWVKIETGMNRLGITQPIDFRQFSLQPQVVMTHLSDAEDESKEKTSEQLVRFSNFLDHCFIDRSVSLLSYANSAASLTHHKVNDNNHILRPGLGLYGVNPLLTDKPQSAALKPVMNFYAPILKIAKLKQGDAVGYNEIWRAQKDTMIAIIGAGYGDGYPRLAANGTTVNINGVESRLVGRVSMDMIATDISAMCETGNRPKVGDIACLWGENPTIHALAESAKTNVYDVLTGLAQRVIRRTDG